MIRNAADVLKIEVEADPTGLVNMIENPSGVDGAWFWITDLANQLVTSDGTKLIFTATVSAAARWVSDFMGVTPGDYLAARFDTVGGTASHTVKVRYNWYDSAQGFLSSSTPTSDYTTAAATNYVAGVQVPVGAAYAKIRFDFYGSSGASNPTAGAHYDFRNAMVTSQPTNSFTSTRANLFHNPSFEVLPTGWTASLGSVARSTVQALYDTYSLRFTAPSGGGFAQAGTDTGLSAIPVAGGKDYTISAYARAATTGRGFRINVSFYDRFGAPISGGAQSLVVTDTTSGWTRNSVTVPAPPRAWYAAATITFIGCGASEQHYVDGLLFEPASTLGGYFSGSTASAGSKSYSWTGGTDDSVSIESNTSFDFAAPVQYINILGPTATITINRAPLDPGVISLQVIDTELDPADADTLRTGRRVRITALDDDTAVFEDLAGRYMINTAKVAYDLTKPAAQQASISITATDALQQLANSNRKYSVATIDELPGILERVGLPWNCNGSYNQVASPTITATQDQATGLDQVILTRDSDLGYAWISKEGVIFANSDRTDDYYGTGVAVLDESVYSDIDVTFDVEECINEVLVVLVHDVSGQTIETTYGPYRDAAAIAEWKVVRQATFRVTGISAGSIPAYAAAILAANSVPVRRVNSVTIPIETPADITRTKALIDLYAQVEIINTAKGLDVFQRVTSISHSIVATVEFGVRWLLTLGFGTDEAVTTPLAPSTGTPGAAGAAGTPGATGATGATGAAGSSGYANSRFDDASDTLWSGSTSNDEEFVADTSSLPSGFSWVNQGTATYDQKFGTGVIAHAGGTNDCKILTKTMPSGTWTATMKCRVSTGSVGGSNATIGFVLRESATGKLVTLGPQYSAGLQINTSRYTAPNAFSASLFNTLVPTWPHYIRLRRNSATSWDLEYSWDGAAWLSAFAAANLSTSFTTAPDQLGLVIANFSGNPARGSFDWMRVR